MARTHQIHALRIAMAVMMAAAAVVAAAADGGTITGRVVDEQDLPVVSITVAIVGTDFETSSEADGSFGFEGVPAGIYLLEAYGAGFAMHTVDSITVVDGKTTEVLFQLEPIPLREIVFTSTVTLLREEPVATVSLDREQIMALPHFGDDLYRAVTVLPGTSSGDISGRFNVRGGLHDEVLVAMDGQELFEPFHLKDFQGVFSIFDPEMIGGVELKPGGFTAEYGDRMTGVLDLSSRTPTATHGSIGISVSNAWANTGGLFADGKGRWLGSVRRGYLDFILDMVGDEDEDDGAPPDPRYWDAFAVLGYDPSPRQSLTLSLLYADDDMIFDEQEPDEFTSFVTGYGSAYVWLRHQGVLGGRSFVNSSLYGGRVTIDRDILAIDYGGPVEERIELIDHRELDMYGIRQDWQHELSDRQYLRWGFELRSYDVSYDYRNNIEIEDPIDDPRFTPAVRITSFNNTYEGEWYGVYATDRVRFANRWTAEIGARYDEQTLTDDDHVSPRVNLLYNVGSSGVARLGWGHFYQTHRPYELGIQFGEEEFQPAQRAEHWTLGYESELGDDYLLRIDAYTREVSDPHYRYETLFDPFHPAPEAATDLVLIAPQSVSADGVEVYLARRNGRKFGWWASYVWSSVEDELPYGNTPRYVDQTNAFTVSGTWRPGPKWSLTGVWSYHSGWPTTAVSAHYVQNPDGYWQLSYDVGPFYQENLPDYHRLDFRASRTTRVGKKGHLTFFIDVQNLYNRENQRGIAIADPEWRQDAQQGWHVAFPEEYWLSIVPSFGVSWEF
jgi:hypothetical protein